jgi:hypothetical protein
MANGSRSGGQVKRILFIAAMAALVTACEGTTDPLGGVGGGGPGGGAVTQAQASGDWTLTLRRTTTLSCAAGSLPDNQVIFAHLDVFSNGALSTATSTWLASPSTVIRALAGTLTFSSGFANLTLFASATNTSSGMELRGTLTATGTLTGTLTDPAPGLTPLFSTSGCEYTVTGSKTS